MNNNLTPHETWHIHDASKVQQFMGCPRQYFWRYVLGWAPSGQSVHLVFGSAWHLAMEHILLNGYNAETLLEAYQLFEDYYRDYFDEQDDMNNKVKNPAVALRALTSYVKKYKDMDRFEVLHTEVAGTVTVNDENPENKYVGPNMHFRMDTIVRDPMKNDQIYTLEHKTASQLSRQWQDQWTLSMQVGLYVHVLYMMYEENEVFGAVVNGAVLRTRDEEFPRIPIRKTGINMQVWLWNMRHYLDMIEWNFKMLEQCTEVDEVMQAFPMNTGNCTKYFGCSYHDFCVSWPNPLQRCEKCPMDMTIKWWNPADNDDTAKKVVEL